MAAPDAIIDELRNDLDARAAKGSGSEPISAASFGAWLDEHTQAAPYLDRSYEPGARQPMFATGDETQHPGLRLFDDATRSEFMFAVRPGRAIRVPRAIRSEAMLAGLRDGDARRMRDALWTFGRLSLAGSLYSSAGTDHSHSTFDLLESLAVGDDALVEDRLPSITPLSRKGYRFAVVTINLLRAMRFGFDIDEVSADTEKFLAGKSTKKFEALMAGYLLAVLDGDEDAAATRLAEVAKTWATSPWSRTWKDPLNKVASLKLHGLAAIGERAMPGISEVANGSAAWSSELVDLVTEMRGLSEGQEPVVELQGRSASVEAILRDRPFHENAGVEVSAG